MIHVAETTHRLDIVQLGVSAALSRYQLEDLAHSIELEAVQHRLGEQLVYQLRAYLYGKKESTEHRFPATWWDAVKIRFFPAWLLRRYPPIFIVIRADATELYPDIARVPGHRSIMIRELRAPMLLSDGGPR